MNRYTLYFPLTAILLIAVVACLSCRGDSHADKMMDCADSVMVEHPDSALHLLRKLGESTSGCSYSQQMRYRLLLADALNKTDFDMSKDTLVASVLSYYNSKGSKKDKARANYLMGRVCDSKGDSPNALHYFHKAVEMMDSTGTKEELRMLATIYCQMAKLYGESFLSEPQKEYINKASHIFTLCKDTAMALMIKGELADVYARKGDLASAVVVARNVSDQLVAQDHEAMSAYVRIKEMHYILKLRQIDAAMVAIAKLEHVIRLWPSNNHLVTIYNCYKAQLLEQKGEEDSAFAYYNQVLPHIKGNVNFAIPTYRGLMTYYGKKGLNVEMQKYAQLYCQANDSSLVHNSQIVNSRIHAQYNYNLAQEAKNKAEQKSSALTIAILVIVLCVTILLFFLFQRYQRRKRMQQAELEKYNAQFALLRKEYEKAMSEYNILECDFESYKQGKNEELSLLRSQIAEYVGDGNALEEWGANRELVNHECVSHLHNLVECNKVPSNQELKDVICFVASHLPEFWSFINTPSKKLTLQELQVCVLLRLYFIPSEVAVIMNISMQRVTNIKAFINMKLFGKKGAKGLEDRLVRILK